MKTYKYNKVVVRACSFLLPLTAYLFMSCSSFLEEQVPQATLTQDEVKDPKYIDDVLTSAYAGLVAIEDMNSSFSLWNYDTRSDDAYVGGASFSDGEPFHRLEKGTGVMTNDWPFGSIWNKLYKYLSRVSLSLDMLAVSDQENAIIQQRTAEMKFLRAYGHFQLKRLFKKIPFVNKPDMTEDDYNNLSNTEYTNDEGWQQIINDLEDAYKVLPDKQAEKGRPTKAAAAAFLAKVYLYKAYRQDDATNNRVTSISSYAFAGCSSLTSVVIPNSVTSIGEGAFNGCGLTSVTILNSVTSIGSYAFYDCCSLTSVIIPNSVTSIGEGAFFGCSSLTSITIPNSVASISEETFECSGLTSVIIPESVTSVGISAFSGCSSLISITIPNSVTNIGTSAFSYCHGITEVYCSAENVPETKSNAFYNSPIASATLYVPESAIEQYQTKEPWSGFGTIVGLTQDELDTVESVKASDATKAKYFDLHGREMSKSKKGLYITAGRVVLAK